MDDLLIRGGHDGSGAPGRDADVALVDGRIVAVEPRSARPARRVVDARGQVAAPGLIDIQRGGRRCESGLGALWCVEGGNRRRGERMDR